MSTGFRTVIWDENNVDTGRGVCYTVSSPLSDGFGQPCPATAEISCPVTTTILDQLSIPWPLTQYFIKWVILCPTLLNCETLAYFSTLTGNLLRASPHQRTSRLSQYALISSCLDPYVSKGYIQGKIPRLPLFPAG